MSGFESGGQHSPSIIAPWSIIGDDSMLKVSTDFSSCFKQNPIALRMEVVCDDHGTNICPDGGVGIYNPGHWGMVSNFLPICPSKSTLLMWYLCFFSCM